MNGQELLRVIDTIHRDKDIDKETLFQGIESALLTAARKKLGSDEDLVIRIDRESGDLSVYDHNQQIVPIDLGRIAAQTAKQVIIQKIREAESDVIFNEFESREKTIITGTVQRIEGPNLIVNLGRVEGIVPKHEQVRGEMYHVGDRIRGYVYEVKKAGSKVRVRLSRTHPEFIQRLFELEVPEIADGIIQIVRLVREPGYRTKIAVTSNDPKIDCVGACVGVRGTRIKNIIDELGGEKIDIIRWNDDQETLIVNALKPAQISSITLDHDNNSALVIVDEDQLSLAIGKRGQNVRLASKLCQWDINIVTYKELEEMRAMEEEDTEAAGEESTASAGDATTPEEAAPEETTATEPPAGEVAATGEEAATDGEPAAPDEPATTAGSAAPEGGEAVEEPGTVPPEEAGEDEQEAPSRNANAESSNAGSAGHEDDALDEDARAVQPPPLLDDARSADGGASAAGEKTREETRRES